MMDVFCGIEEIRKCYVSWFNDVVSSYVTGALDFEHAADKLFCISCEYAICENSYRKGLFRGLIFGQGLEEQVDTIVGGLNASLKYFNEPRLKKVNQEDFLDQFSEDLRRERANSNMALSCFMTYLEDWKRYNILLSELTEK